jgi:hypothetical protein
MNGGSDNVGDADAEGLETRRRFVATLIVTTVMVAVTAYVLSYAVLPPGTMGPAHGAAAATQHTRT